MICYTSSGINLFIHVCGGKVSNFSLTAKEVVCSMETKVCEFSKVNHKTAFNDVNDCCKNHSVKTSLKVQTSENIDNLDLSLSSQKINAFFIPSISYLLGYQLNEFIEISPHFIPINSTLKNGIYLFLQNFRN
jgi:hypothetical protein